MRLVRAWQEWDNWCIRQGRRRWPSSDPNSGRQQVVDLERALRAGEAKLGLSRGTLRPLIKAERRAGYSLPEAVERVVSRLRSSSAR